MNVANQELCQELYELSRWEDTSIDAKYHQTRDSRGEQVPAYDLGYLLRKLPNFIDDDYKYLSMETGAGYAFGYAVEGGAMDGPTGVADIPEDSACKLAIELFKRGILTKEANEEQI